MPPRSEDLSEFFQTRGKIFRRCCDVDMQCAEPAIRAHSIQNRQAIELLQSDNHVLAWVPRFLESGPQIALESVGRNQASTFAGFCANHDAEYFRSIDTQPLDIGNWQQLFLLAYRAITHEFQAIGTAVVQLQSLYEARVNRGVEPQSSASLLGSKSVEQMALGFAVWRYRKEYYDQQLRDGTFDGVEHAVIEVETSHTCFAAASFVTVKDVPLSEVLVGAAVNVLPVTDTKTVGVFSYAPKDRGAVRAALDRILGSTGEIQRYELSKFILSRISNVLISPAHFASWPPEKAEKIVAAFTAATKAMSDVEDDADLMLF